MDRSAAGKLGYAKVKEAFDLVRVEKAQAVREAYEALSKHCPQCHVPIPYEKRENVYCGHSCRAKHTLTGTKRPNRKNARVILPCPCGQATTRKNKWCDACIAIGRAGRIKVWELSEARTDATRRRYLLRTRPHRCAEPRCGVETWLGGPVPLEMDHIDGNSDNNTEENLRLLCPNCHALTPSHKGRNRGKGRTRQRVKNQRYADGLKY